MEDSEVKVKSQVVDYYDKYTIRQKRVGANIRIRGIFIRLVRSGLSSRSNVLEIGCGVGLLTELLLRVVKRGAVVSTDISPKSIEEARIRNRSRKNVTFHETDMRDFKTEMKFDFVILADVLEHIPVENHNELFAILKKHTHQKSKIFINIPSPFHIEYLQKYAPEQLQIIDQPLFMKKMVDSFEHNGFYVNYLESYSLFYNFDDYQWMSLDRFVNTDSSSKKSRHKLILSELLSRLSFLRAILFKR